MGLDFIKIYFVNLQEFGQTLNVQVLWGVIQELLGSLSILLNILPSGSDFMGTLNDLSASKASSFKSSIPEAGFPYSIKWMDYLKSFITSK